MLPLPRRGTTDPRVDSPKLPTATEWPTPDLSRFLNKWVYGPTDYNWLESTPTVGLVDVYRRCIPDLKECRTLRVLLPRRMYHLVPRYVKKVDCFNFNIVENTEQKPSEYYRVVDMTKPMFVLFQISLFSPFLYMGWRVSFP